ncbi:MAG: hypothetical protein WKF84_29375 [Pyrinomonadaceae bacterium]
MYQLPKSRDLGINTCAACFDKQREIDRLREEVTRLKGMLRYRERQEQALPFASSTPSSKIPVKANTAVAENEEARRRTSRSHWSWTLEGRGCTRGARREHSSCRRVSAVR